MSILKPRKDAEITVDFGVAKIKRVDGGFVYDVVLINLKKGSVVVKTVNSSIINPSFVFICFWILYMLISVGFLYMNDGFLNVPAEKGNSFGSGLLYSLIIWGLILALLDPFPLRGSIDEITPIGAINATIGFLFITYWISPAILVGMTLFVVIVYLFKCGWVSDVISYQFRNKQIKYRNLR